MNSELESVIERIELLKTEVDSLRPLKPEQEQRLLQKIRLDWNYHSSKIEGNTLSYGETKALLYWGITAQGKPLRDHLEIKGHNEAVEYIMDILKGNEIPITEAFIRNLHKIIIPEPYNLDAKTPDGMITKRKITPGEYKQMPNHVQTPTGEMFYFASPEETPAKMMDLMAWFRKECEEKQDHPLIIASMFHYQFVRIHPFDDGNGRMSRLLMNLILMQFGYPPVIVQTELREEYLNSLQYADVADFDKFILFIGDRLVESLELWIKAANGEPIEEYDDIDKMVKMLKTKIEWKGLDSDIKLEKKLDNIIDTLSNSIIPLFKEFENHLKKFDAFFMQKRLILFIGGVANPVSNYGDFENSVKDYWSKNKLLNNVGFDYFYNEIGKSNYKNQIEIVAQFEQFYYLISNNQNSNIIQRRYHQELSEEDIKQIILPIIESVFNKINKEIDKANGGGEAVQG